MARVQPRVAAVFVALLVGMAGGCWMAAAQTGAGVAAGAAEIAPLDRFVWERNAGLKAARAALRSLTTLPDAPETVVTLLGHGRLADALAVADRIVDRHPERIPGLVGRLASQAAARYRFFEDRSADYPARLAGLADRIRARIPDLGREEAAAVLTGLQALDLRPGAAERRDADLVHVLRDYPGTDAALMAEIDRIPHGASQRGDMLEAFARAHPGTTAAARALHSRAFDLAHNPPVRMGRGATPDDPARRFFQVLDIVRELESGRYPASEWTGANGGELVTGFYVDSRVGWPEDRVDEVIAAHWAFAKSHFSLDAVAPADSGIGYLVARRLPDLYARVPDGRARYEAAFAEFTRTAPDPAGAAYLRAVGRLDTLRSAPTPAEYDAAIALLRSLHGEGQGPFPRKALATLATLQLHRRDVAAARASFADYVRQYPRSPYAWLASLRVGQCDGLLERWTDAAAAFQATATSYADEPMANVLAHVYAARALEATGDPGRARAAYKSALAGWTEDMGASVSAPLAMRRAEGDDGWGSPDPTAATRADLNARIVELDRTLASPDGVDLERARWLLGRGRYREAAERAGRVAAANRRSVNAAEARLLAQRARLEEALALADVDRPGADESAAMRLLDALSQESFDFPVMMARIAKACLLRKEQRADEASALLNGALKDWQRHQASLPAYRHRLSPLEQDVADIRALVFRPAGDREFRGTTWNGFRWPSALPPFVVADPEVDVVLADRTRKRPVVYQALVDLPNVLFFDGNQVRLFDTLMARLGGTKRRQADVMREVPNQPIGPSLDIRAFLGSAFPVIPGHWGGWIFETFPTIDRIEFHDAGRTRAVARVVVGYAGGDVLLEKTDGRWRIVKVERTWVT